MFIEHLPCAKLCSKKVRYSCKQLFEKERETVKDVYRSIAVLSKTGNNLTLHEEWLNSHDGILCIYAFILNYYCNL